MNYTKAQQEIVSWIMADTKRGVAYFEDTRNELITFCHPDGSHAYTVPSVFVAVNLGKCTQLHRPLVIDDREGAHLLDPTGNLVEQVRALVEYKNRQGAPIYFNKRLLDKYGKAVKLYQPKPLYPAVVVGDELNVMVGVLCPVRRKTENQ